MNRLLVIAFTMLCGLSAQASERILDFHSDIVIAADGSMTVAETIRVNAEGDRIRRGIYRDFPTDYRDQYGNRIKVLFEPIDVTRDGIPEPWHDESRSNGVRVYFGTANVSIGHGEHTYVFRYRTTRQLGFFEEHDELYWNVTGNGWGFTIDSASAEVSLPGNVDASQIKVEGYTGKQGSKARNYSARVDGDGQAIISTTQALPPGNGLTLVVSFPKGHIAEPSTEQKLAWLAADNRDERILDFHSDIVIAADGSMTVAETIRVNAEGDRIRRGIYRDFPTDYRDQYGNRIKVLFEPIDVTRDGHSEPWHDEGRSNGVRVYFGSANDLLDRGEHTYVFRYRTARQLGFFDDHDELYWNVTGNGWGFTIDSASAELSLPGNVDASQIKVEGYTGEKGSKARNYSARVDGDGHAIISTTQALPPGNGLTLVVSFPKGLIAKPSTEQKLAWFAAENRREAVLGIGLLILLGFLYLQWRRVGVDPKGGIVIPEYEPPPDISPAAARYIRRMGYDDRCFAADMVDLGVCGAVTISKSGSSSYSVARASEPDSAVPESARVLYDGLLGSRANLEFKNTNHTIIGSVRGKHNEYLKNTYAKANFRTNTGIGCLGVLISIATIIAAFLVDRLSQVPEVVLPTIITLSLALGASTLISNVIATWNGVDRPIGMGIIALVTTIALAFVAGFLASTASYLFAILVVLLAGVQVPFARWMRAPTVPGRKLLDRIEGLRLYLGVAERDDLARAKAPPMNVDEYQRLLPYALALDVEKTWGDKLADAIGPAAVAAAAAGMAWYAGDMSRGFDARNFGSSLGSSLSSAISSSSSAPGSSSGSGGGGSSGGGGGGGGGGGW